MAPFEPAGAALLAAGRHRHAPKALIALLSAVIGALLLVGLRVGTEGQAAVPTPPPDSPGASLGEVPGSGNGIVTGIDGEGFLLALSEPIPELSLGRPAALRITLTNPNDQALILQSVTTTVLDPADRGCLAGWLDVGDYEATDAEVVGIPAGGEAVITLPLVLVNLPDVNQDACQGAGFPIRLTGTASLT